jgi:hypothetical protein
MSRRGAYVLSLPGNVVAVLRRQCFFYLVDIDKKNGGTEFYVGSHKFHEQDLDTGRVS